MAQNKTQATERDVDDHIAAIASDAQRAECVALVELLSRIAGEPAKMWGPSIIGFGSYHYRYDSGREGDAARTGCAVRGRDLVVYLVASGANQDALLAKLGKHKIGKSCLYIRSLQDVDLAVLEQLVVESLAELTRQYG